MADRSLVRMAKGLPVIMEGTVHNLLPHLLVRIPEGDAGKHFPVDSLNTESTLIERIVHQPFRYGHRRGGKIGNVEDVVHHIKDREENFKVQGNR